MSIDHSSHQFVNSTHHRSTTLVLQVSGWWRRTLPSAPRDRIPAMRRAPPDSPSGFHQPVTSHSRSPSNRQVNKFNKMNKTCKRTQPLMQCSWKFVSVRFCQVKKKSSLQRSGIESRGLTTVVLPAPMIICFTPLSPPSTVRWKSEIMATCLSCSILLSENLAGNQKPARMINGQTQSLSTKSVWSLIHFTRP